MAARPKRIKSVAPVSVDEVPGRPDMMAVAPVYVTMTGIAATSYAVRIAFGEATAQSAKFHSAVAMDYRTAKSLLESLQEVVERKESGKLDEDDGDDEALNG